MKNKYFYPVSFNNVDIFYIELDGTTNDTDFIDKAGKVQHLINEIVGREYIIMHLEDVKITKNIFNEVIVLVNTNIHKFKRLGFVGVHGFSKLKLMKYMKSTSFQNYFFCNDLQKAKEIMVG
jgi:hypothetical protein